ncbi:hypothetical protein BGZ73_008190 [Actinomortierella ambigua]|nr:hypothetical protein BGZ73_008190 [Actinomortierella ambigua]
MAKGDIPTPPGTGTVGKLTPEQKTYLREMWSQMLDMADNGTVNLPATPSAETDSIASSKQDQPEKKKKSGGWFGTSKSSASPAPSSPSSSSAGDSETVRVNLADIGLPADQLRPALWNNVLGDHPDSLMLRFLRARKWNDVLNERYRGFRLQMEMGKSFVHGQDKEGRPVVYINVRLHKPADQDPKALEKFTIYVMETGRLMISPPVETACLVFDMTGFQLANMDYNFVKFLVQCFEAYYPESLGVLLIHKAPFVFWGVWKIIEPWLDPVVASKIKFTRSDSELTQYIPAERLPDKYDGGKDHYKYEYIPVSPSENDRMKDTETKERLMDEWKALMWKFEALTREWCDLNKPTNKSTRTEAEIEAERDQVAKDLRAAYFRLDPYIRARNLYHRSEHPVLQADGSSIWTYKN